jgi:secreted trypsin-like serine protease
VPVCVFLFVKLAIAEMRSIVAVLLLACLCDAKPMLSIDVPIASFGRLGIDNQIVNGQDASIGEWPWQLSQQRQASTGAWSHSCGASLLSGTTALSAAHCVDGASAAILRVIAGLWARSDTSTAQQSDVSYYTKHQSYDDGSASYANDIAILHLSTTITTSNYVRFLTLPPDNNNNFAGSLCWITGWGRTSSSNILPDILQEAEIGVITTADCASRMSAVSGVVVWDNHICLYDSAQRVGSCNGDSGGPLNCPNGQGGYYVAGVTSWGISSSAGNCLQTYPSVYTRTSAYIDWIGAN